MRNGARRETDHQFRNATQLALLAIFIECAIQTVGEFLGFDLKQDAIEQGKLTAVHVLDFFVQQRLQFFRFNRHLL